MLRRVIVVDDDWQVREMCRRALEAEGYVVEEAANGFEAVASFRREPAALVVCDIYMPDKDGIETIRELLDEFPCAQILAISGGAMGLPDLGRVAVRLGARRSLEKPFAMDDLLAIVRELTED